MKTVQPERRLIYLAGRAQQRLSNDVAEYTMGKRRPSTPLPSVLPDTLYGAAVDAELDLHGFRAAPALQRVDGFLAGWASRKPGAVLRIITGKGTHSADGPVLLEAVGHQLRERLGGQIADLIGDSGGGGWVVRLGLE